MTLQELIERLQELPESAKTAPVYLGLHAEDEDLLDIDDVKYERGIVESVTT